MLAFLLLCISAQDTKPCTHAYYTHCKKDNHCGDGYHKVGDRNSNCFLGYHRVRCMTEWVCPIDKHCGDPGECNDFPECLESTSDFDLWTVTSVKWKFGEAVVEHLGSEDLPTALSARRNETSGADEAFATARWTETTTNAWVNAHGPIISDGLPFSSSLPLYTGNARFSESPAMDHVWGQSYGDHTPASNVSLACPPGIGEACKIRAERAIVNSTFTLELHYAGDDVVCISTALWSGLAYYDLRAVDIRQSEDADAKSTDELRIFQTPYALVILGGAALSLALCISILFCLCHCCEKKKDPMAPVILSPVVSDMPNYKNRTDFDITANTNLLS